MSQEFVSRDEIVSILAPYAKSSDLEVRVRETDTSTRLVLDRSVSAAQQTLQLKLLGDLSAVRTEVMNALQSQIVTAKDSVLREVEIKLAAFRTSIAEQAASQALEVVAKKTSEIYAQLQGSQTKLKEDIEFLVKQKHEDSGSRLESFLPVVETSAKAIAEEVAVSKVQSLQTTLVSTVQGALSEISQSQTRAFQEFRAVLETELSQKVIDKAQIERKIIEIEGEMQSRIRSVIEFQIEQARAMMEQSARSEVRDGVQASLITLLSK
jgi:hypothetical protein